MAESPSEAAGPAGPLLPPTGLKGELWGWRGSLSLSQLSGCLLSDSRGVAQSGWQPVTLKSIMFSLRRT